MKTLIKKINRILKDRGTRRLLTRIVSVSAALVVFVTTYALVLPAITMETEAQCGIEAHQHSDSCYEDVLVCGLEESEGHTHDDSCYSISHELTCETPEHQHDKTCYDEDGNLQCKLSEHDHTDNCYKEVRELTCTLEESEGHHHTDACYEKNLICGKEVHTHSSACYEKTEAAAVAASEGYTAGVAYEVNDDDAADDFGSSDTDGLEVTDDAGYTDGLEATGESDDADALEETDGPDGADALEETDSPGDTDAPEWTDHNDASEDAVTFEETGDPGDTDASEQTDDPGEPGALEVTSHDAIWEDADNAGTSEAADYSDSSEETGSADPSHETDNAGPSDWDPPLQEESEAAPTTNILPEDLENEELSDGYVPQLDSLNFDSVLNDHTAFYYFHPEEGEEVPANSVDIASWKPVDENTELAPTDLVKAYLAYTIPAGSLNETNQVARYRLPSNLHLTEEQILAINSHENGIAAGYIDPETNTVPDEDAANYSEYLGAEAVEGTRRPDQAPGDGSVDGEQEYISATVKAENVFDEEGLYGEKGAYLGQDLIFVFSPYTIQKNQTTYDKDGKPTARGEKVTGWFAVDFNMDQIDWSEPVETILPADNEGQTTAAEGLQRIERTANIVFAAEGEDENNHKIHEISTELKLVQENATEITNEDQPVADAEEQVETPESDEVKKPSDEKSETDQTDNSDSAEHTDSAENDANAETDSALAENKEGETEKAAPEYKDGTLEANGSGYKITMDYKADARIPENAYLHVTEITRESDAEAYEACLEEARKSVPADGTRVDDKASRFFDIEILVDEPVSRESENKALQPDDQKNAIVENDNAVIEKSETEKPEPEKADSEKTGSEDTVSENQITTRKIEPAAPVSVNIQLFDTEISQKPEEFNAEQYKVVHIAEDKTEEIQDVKAQTIEPEKKDATSASAEKESDSDTTAVAPVTEVQFEAESFSIYGVVYTVDFHWEVDGKEYEFSLPGGGFVTLKTLMEVLGVARDSKEDQKNNELIDTESSGSLVLEDVHISGETNTFVADVEKVEFSNPKLVWVGKTEAETTVGAMKDANSLDCQYSTELAKDQIDKINAQSVEAGDWALISLKPFISEEMLTVTMKDGEAFQIQVTDGQLHTYAISDSGDTYEIIVTYDDTAEIPDNAELKVREIKSTEAKYAANVEATNKELQAQEIPEVVNPAQFDISIIANGVEIEPKEGSTVKVEIRLVPEVFSKKSEDTESDPDNFKSEEEEGEFWFNGEKILEDEENAGTHYTVSHITSDGIAKVIEDVSSSVNEDKKIILKFETESFSDYLFDESTTNTLWALPDTIYVGDEIYMYNRADYWVTNIGPVVTETKHPNGQGGNDGSKWKTVTAVRTGTFRIYNRYNQNEYKEITVRPARTGTTPPGTIDTVDNASIGLTLNLFDYDLDNYLDDYFNNYNHGDNPVSNNFLNRSDSINNGHALKFWGSGIGDTHGAYNQYNKYLVTNIVKNTTDTGKAGGYPVLAHNNSSLSYLFTPSDGTDKKAYTNVNHLFKKSGDYYVYDSNENYAYYDKSQGNGGNFVVYNSTYEQKSRDDGGEQASHTNGKAIGFFPFHPWDNQYDLYVNWNKNLNHHFGMSMSVPFSMPKAPKAVEDTAGNPIIFEFSGDDDLWVFIDGKLAMDIGGIHQPTSGTINFTNKTVTVNGQSQNFNFSNLYDGKKHTLQVFYIERGGCDSNCKIMFNLTQYGDVEFDKVDADDNSILLPGAVFGLYKDPACTQPVMEKLDVAHGGTSRSFTVETDEQGHAKLEDVPLGDYYLKEIHAPDGYPITVGAEAARVRVYLDASGNVKVSVNGTETGAKITNKKPSPIHLGLKKEWQDENEQTISAPDGVTAVFEIKRMRTYEIHTEEKIEGEGRQSSHLTVGWLHNGQPYEYEEFDLVAESQVTVSWGYVDGYEGTIGCRLGETEYTKSPNPNNIYSQGFDMPAAGQSAVFYIIDDSDNGEAISGINVAGSQFYGNSGGGYIHTFHKITETDPVFTYTGDNVTDNKVTLPVNGSTWQYLFSNLPTFGNGTVHVAVEEGGQAKDYQVAFSYTYYLEEVTNTAPEGTTVVYKDFNGNEFHSPTDVESSTSGTETVINRVPYGYLKIEKKVTFSGSDQNLTSEQKSKLAGEYKFKIYKKAQCGDGDAVKDPEAAEDAIDKDLMITITIDENGQAASSAPIKLLAGKYWIKEVESSNPVMFPVDNPIEVTVKKDHTAASPVISSLTNNYDENNGPDKITIDIEKKFRGLDSSDQVPSNFQVVLQYTLKGQTRTVTLHNNMATGENGETITWTESADGFTWHWTVSNIDPGATNFKIKESNYDKATGYDWKNASLNGTDITSSVSAVHDLTVTAPKVTFGNDVKTERITSDSEYNTAFFLLDDDVLLTALTAHQGSLVISKKPLNLMQRKAVEQYWPGQGSIKKPAIYFSIEEHPNGFTYGNKTIVFGEKEGKAVVKFTSNASSNEAIFVASYTSQEALNIANLVNTYEEVPITIDIIKVEQDNLSEKLPGAIFTLRQIADKAPTENGTLQTLDGTTPTDSVPTDDNGKTSFNNLTHGYYEISEKTAPDGYVLSADLTFYFKIESGVVKWLVKGTNKPSEWAEKEEKAEGELVDFEPAHPAIGADPENNVVAQSAANAAFTVENTPGAALPNTGGPGTRLIYLLGLMLACTAGAGLLLRKHRSPDLG